MKIKSIASAFPSKKYDVDTIADWTGADPDFIRDKIGSANRFYLDREETGVSLAKQAVEKLLANEEISFEDVELLIYVTQTPDYAIPHNSALLHGEMGGKPATICFDVGLGCSGYPHAISIAKNMMIGEGLNNAIVVTCDPYSKIMDKHDKATTAVFGDAATATLLSNDGHIEIGKADFGTMGDQGKSALLIKSGHGANPIHSVHDERNTLSEESPDDYCLYMNGRNVFNFVMNEIPASLDRVYEKNGLKKDEIDLFALHQGSLYMLQNMIKRHGIDSEKVIFNIADYGNTVSSSVPLVLEEIMSSDPSFEGKVAISGFGVGVSWATNILYFNPL